MFLLQQMDCGRVSNWKVQVSKLRSHHQSHNTISAPAFPCVNTGADSMMFWSAKHNGKNEEKGTRK